MKAPEKMALIGGKMLNRTTSKMPLASAASGDPMVQASQRPMNPKLFRALVTFLSALCSLGAL